MFPTHPVTTVSYTKHQRELPQHQDTITVSVD